MSRSTSSSQWKQQQEQKEKEDQKRFIQQLGKFQQLSEKVIKQKQRSNQKIHKYSFDNLGIISVSKQQIIDIFGDIRFAIIMGPDARAIDIADKCVKVLRIDKSYQKIGDSPFFSVYKIGPILSCSHGMGISSVCLFLNEFFRIMNIAQNNQFELLRLGSSGGIGIDGGTLVISTHALDPITCEPEWVYYSLGVQVKQECIFNAQMSKRLHAIAKAKNYKVEFGKTVSTETYYEGQARLDGAICPYNEKDKQKYLQKLYNFGVRNFEMEGTVVSGTCTKNGIRCAMLAVAYLDRLKQDTVSKIYSEKEIKSWMVHAIDVVLQYIMQFILK